MAFSDLYRDPVLPVLPRHANHPRDENRRIQWKGERVGIFSNRDGPITVESTSLIAVWRSVFSLVRAPWKSCRSYSTAIMFSEFGVIIQISGVSLCGAGL